MCTRLLDPGPALNFPAPSAVWPLANPAPVSLLRSSSVAAPPTPAPELGSPLVPDFQGAGERLGCVRGSRSLPCPGWLLLDTAPGSGHLRCHCSALAPRAFGTVPEPSAPGATKYHLSVQSPWCLPSWGLLFCCSCTGKSRWCHRGGGWQGCAVGTWGIGDARAP